MRIEGVLTPEQMAAGLRLEEEEDLVYLYYKGKLVATWSSKGVSGEAIRQEAEKYIRY